MILIPGWLSPRQKQDVGRAQKRKAAYVRKVAARKQEMREEPGREIHPSRSHLHGPFAPTRSHFSIEHSAMDSPVD